MSTNAVFADCVCNRAVEELLRVAAQRDPFHGRRVVVGFVGGKAEKIRGRTVAENFPSDIQHDVRCTLRILGAALLLVFLCPLLAYGQNIHLQAVRVPNRLSHWPQSGFVDMVPPVRLPTNSSRTEKIMVWLRIPKGKKISVHWLANQKRYTLRFPPGTVTDRIDGTKRIPMPSW